MIRYWMLVVVLSLSCGGCKATTSCKKKVADSYLDMAVDMIEKAKLNFPSPVDFECVTNHARGALDCSELLQRGYKKSGIYTIQPANRITAEKSVEVYCDMQTDGGGWTVIQRRGNFQNAADYFHKGWEIFKEGFGHLEKEFWLGNDNIFALSNQNLYSARIDLRDLKNNTRYARYDTFWIEDENRQYKLHIADYTGDAGDSMEGHNNKNFSTKDRDNDVYIGNCAQMRKGAWWYSGCISANLNGLNMRENLAPHGEGLIWKTWKGYGESMASTEIKIRPRNFRHHLSLETRN